MGSSRTYGLDTSNEETVQPQPYTLVGHGAGSIFKIFTTAAAMEKGLGTSAVWTSRSASRRAAWATAAPAAAPRTYCVQNATNNYPAKMSVTDALAQSPNTAFVKLIQSTASPPPSTWRCDSACARTPPPARPVR